MKNQFSIEYAKHVELVGKFHEAKTANNEAEMQSIREAHEELMESIKAKGTTYNRIYSKYEDAQERGNSYIDFGDVIWDDKVEEFVKGLRDCGVEKFVFSASWSSAVETAWLLQQNGCKLEGLIEINGITKVFGTDEYKKAHGYLFSL